MSGWDALEIQTELVIDYHVDYTDLIDDKSISVATENLQSAFDENVCGKKLIRKGNMTSRRLLCEVLERKHIDIERICDLIRCGRFHKGLYNIILSSKEREAKIEPRLFAMMPLELILYFCVTESNVSKKVFPYFPQTSMTMDEKTLTRRVFQIAGARHTQGVAIVLLSIDFKSWNLHWSIYSTGYIFAVLDKLFGVSNLYESSHNIFRKCKVVLGSRLNPSEQYKLLGPTSVRWDKNRISENSWTDHEGGFEGIRQFFFSFTSYLLNFWCNR